MILEAITPVANINSADALTMKEALIHGQPMLDLQHFEDWKPADQAAVIESVLQGIPKNSTAERTGYEKIEYVQIVLSDALQNRTPLAKVNLANDSADLNTALATFSPQLDLTAYDALSDADRQTVLNGMLNDRPVDGYVDQTSLESALTNRMLLLDVLKAKESLAITFTDDDSSSSVTRSFLLPEHSSSDHAITVSWESDNPALISPSGQVTRPDARTGNQQVKLTATLQKGTQKTTREFSLTVKAIEQTPSPLPSDIQVRNRILRSDTVTVSALMEGDILSVYAEDGTTLLGQKTILPGGLSEPSASATITIGQLGVSGGRIQVSVTRAGMSESDLVFKSFAAENAKPYRILNESLDRTASLTASVTVAPTGDIEPEGDKFVVFQLMKGDTPEQIIVKQSSVHEQETLQADFNKPNDPTYTVRAFVVSDYGTSGSGIGRSLAAPVVIR